MDDTATVEFCYAPDEYGNLFPALHMTISDFNVLECIAGTTGFFGADAEDGSRTFLQIKGNGYTRFKGFKVLKNTCNEFEGFRVLLDGDSELRTLILALRFAADSLEQMAIKKPLEAIDFDET